MSQGYKEGIIFDTQRFSIHDGPGIRSLVFLKGCPLRCKWCSNPEGLTKELSIMSNPDKCIGCGECLKICDVGAISFDKEKGYVIDRDLCNLCGKCAIVCPSESKKSYGEIMTAEKIIRLVKSDSSFYRSSGGGLTLGGGEILFQPEFAYEIIKGCKKEGINTAIETCGLGNWQWLDRITDYVDTIHYDIKTIDSEKHKRLTGAGNETILKNIILLDKKIKEEGNIRSLIIRVPLIKGYNDEKEDIKKLGEFIKENLDSYEYVEFLPFHNFGEQKYKNLDMDYEFEGVENAKAEDFEILIDTIKNMDINAKITMW